MKLPVAPHDLGATPSLTNPLPSILSINAPTLSQSIVELHLECAVERTNVHALNLAPGPRRHSANVGAFKPTNK